MDEFLYLPPPCLRCVGRDEDDSNMVEAKKREGRGEAPDDGRCDYMRYGGKMTSRI